MTFADLRALHAILGDAIDDIQRIYAPEHVEIFVDNASQASNSLYASPPPSPSITEFPLDFPSLDQPFDSNDPAEQLTAHPTVVTAINRIVAAAGQLAVMVQSPFYAICDASMGYHLPSCLRLLEASHTVELLREAGPEGLHVDLISERNGVESSRLAHVLRLLATHHFICERAPNVFALSRLSSLIDSGKSFEQIKIWENEGRPETKYQDTDGIAAFVGLCTDELFKSSAYLTEAYLTSLKDPSSTPFEHAFNTDLGFFAWLEGEGSRTEDKGWDGADRENEEKEGSINRNKFRLERFGIAMSGTGSWEAPGAVFSGFDWRSLPRGSVIVDVGGGIGFTSMLLANAFSDPSKTASIDGLETVEPNKRTENQEFGFKFVIQDREVVVEMGKKAWRSKCPEFLDSGTVEFQVHDFFTTQPIRNAAVFLLRVVLHDWPNAQARKILLRLREAAAPETKLVLADFVLPLACVDGGDNGGLLEEIEGANSMLAPSPLLANQGKASANAYWQDLTMHVVFNSQERTLREIRALALSAGWKVIKVTHAPGSLFGHIVAVPMALPAQARADAGGESVYVDSLTNSKPFPSVNEIGEGVRDDTVTLHRASSRCGTPTFGSRTILPSVQEKTSRFFGVKNRVSKLAEKLKRPASGILKQAAGITTSTAATIGKKRPSPLSLSSPVRGSMNDSSGSPVNAQPSSPMRRKISLLQLGSASPSHLVQRQSPPSPLSPMHPSSQSHQRTLSRRESHAQLSQHAFSSQSTMADPPSSPSASSHHALTISRYRALGRTASHANLSRRSDSQSTTSSVLVPSSPPQAQPQSPRLHTLSRPKSHAQLHHRLGDNQSKQPLVPVPSRQPEGMTTEKSSLRSPRPPSPLLPPEPIANTSVASRSKSFPSPKPNRPAIHHRSSLAQLRPPQVTLRKRSGTLVSLPIAGSSAGMNSSGRTVWDFRGGNRSTDREVAHAQGCDPIEGGSVLAAAAVIDSDEPQKGSLKARRKFIV